MKRAERQAFSPSYEAYIVLCQLSELLDKPKSTLVRELLDDCLPVLRTTVQALRVVQSQPEMAKALLDDRAARTINDLTQSQIVLSDHMELRRGPKPKPKAKGKA